MDFPLTDRRATARRAARRATLAWVNTALDALAELAESAGLTGPDRIVVFLAGVDHGEGDQWREDLRAALFASRTDEVVAHYRRPDRPLWPAAVEAWCELREALAAYNGEVTPPGIVVSLDDGAVGCWAAYYCPDVGAIPDWVQLVPAEESLAAEEEDPYAALLSADPGSDAADAQARVEQLLALHEVDAPSEPAHAPGECDIDPADGQPA